MMIKQFKKGGFKAELGEEKEKKILRAKREKERREAGLPRIVGPIDDI